jgi:hypothetical protein
VRTRASHAGSCIVCHSVGFHADPADDEVSDPARILDDPFLASAYASWHRGQAAKDAGASNTTAGRFIRTLAIVAARSSSTSATRRRVRCGLAFGWITTWPSVPMDLRRQNWGPASTGLGRTSRTVA